MDKKTFMSMINGIIKEIEEDSRPISSEQPAAANPRPRQRSRSRPRPRPQPDGDYKWTQDEVAETTGRPERMFRPFDESPWRDFTK